LEGLEPSIGLSAPLLVYFCTRPFTENTKIYKVDKATIQPKKMASFKKRL
jgi:hypothetical protein